MKLLAAPGASDSATSLLTRASMILSSCSEVEPLFSVVYRREGHSEAFFEHSKKIGCLDEAFCERICDDPIPE